MRILHCPECQYQFGPAEGQPPKTCPNSRGVRLEDGPRSAPFQFRAHREQEYAHALYTVVLHAAQGGQTLILDRIAGTANRYPELLDTYPQLRDVLGTRIYSIHRKGLNA